MIRKTSDVADRREIAPARDWQATIASQIERARTTAGLSRQQLANKTGLRQSTIANLENPAYRGQSLATIERIAQCLGLRMCVELISDNDVNAEDAAAIEWLKTCAPSNAEMLKWAATAEIPAETNDDTDEERPW
ncbi:MAG TPA: helix-turn-helix transcriptional regulator [Pirellulales bacterium]